MNPAETQKTEQIWEVEINNCIYQSNLRELKDWIRIGKLDPTHKVRMKKLSWIEADNVPAFKKLFEAKNQIVKVTTGTIQQVSPLQSLSTKESPVVFTPITPSAGKKESDSIITLKTPEPVSKSPLGIQPNETVFTIQTQNQNQPEPVILGKKLIEGTFFCPTCFYFCRFIPVSAEKTFFACPICFADCFFVRSTDEKSIGQPKVEPKTRTIFELSELGTSAKITKKKGFVGILMSILIAFLLAVGGSYLWVYQLRSPLEIDENTNNELVVLQEKFTTDKISISFRFAALEQISKTENSQDTSPPNSDISQELAKLQNQYDLDRKSIVENYQDKKSKNDFEKIALISFVSLAVLYFLKRLLLS